MIENMVRKYTEFMHVTQEWETFEPPSVQEFINIAMKPKYLLEF
jgi:hypothetical protein